MRNPQWQASAKTIKITSMSRTIPRHCGRYRGKIRCGCFVFVFVFFTFIYVYIINLLRTFIFKIFAHLETASPKSSITKKKKKIGVRKFGFFPKNFKINHSF